MKNTCDIVKDLLPLYVDGLCSDTSREFIEEHLVHCKNCQTELHYYQTEVPTMKANNQQANINEASNLRSISKKWKRSKATSFFIGTSIISFLATVFCIIAYQINGSYVDDNGMLIESFGYIPLAFLFLFITIISVIVVVILFIKNKKRK